jgi:transketolase
MRKVFAEQLFGIASQDSKVILLSLDLGYGMWNRMRDEIPNQFYNLGAAEFSGLGIAVGMSLEGKIPVVYSATSFLLYRGFEIIRNYINVENIPVKLVGAGRDKDYLIDGFTHWSEEAKEVLNLFPNICTHWPETKEDIPSIMEHFIYSPNPEFISLRR